MSNLFISPVIVLNGVNLTTNQVSTGIHIQNVDNIGLSIYWTGTPVGTLGVNVCNDATLGETGIVTGGTWTPLTLTSPSPPAPAGTAGTGAINLVQLGFAFMQVSYTATSGTGVGTCWLAAKSV